MNQLYPRINLHLSFQVEPDLKCSKKISIQVNDYF